MSALSRSKTIAILLLVLMCLSLETAKACSPIAIGIKITCNSEHDYLPFDQSGTGKVWSVDPVKLASLGQVTCGSEIPADNPRIAEIVADYGDHHTYLGTSNLEFTPYTTYLLNALEQQNRNLLTCRTNFYEVVEDWIVHYKHRPEYCGSERLSVYICGTAERIYLFPFLAHLITTPGPVTWWYLGIIGIGVSAFGLWLWRQRSLSFFKPTAPKAFLFLLLYPSLLVFTVENGFSLDIGTLGWALMVWSIVSACVGLFRFVKKHLHHSETPVGT